MKATFHQTSAVPSRARRRDAKREITLGEGPLCLEDIVALAKGAARPLLANGVHDRMQRSAEVLASTHTRGKPIYGVTTSVGASVGTYVPPERSNELSLNVVRMHGCGTGRKLTDEESAAVIAVRLCALVQGKSGVRPLLAERLVELLTHRALPCIPAEGSVGASGDLTPLSYVAAVLAGEREVSFRGQRMAAGDALREIGLAPLAFHRKEALALTNGTSMTTALTCLAWSRARRLARLSSLLTAGASLAVRGNPDHFDSFVHDAKPHPGQQQVARWVREGFGENTVVCERLQDRYSIRCAPHVVGVLVDALAWTRGVLETEVNGVSDNPVVDVERATVHHGGNFYGSHVGFAADMLRAALANVVCLIDRQIMLLCNPSENAGLPADLVGVEGPEACAHNGFKAVTIAASSLAAEALKLTMPASAFTRSTELHNQDKVPMATLSARDFVRVVEIAETVAAMGALAVCQAFDLRGEAPTQGAMGRLYREVRAAAPRLEGDRRLDVDIEAVADLIREDRVSFDVFSRSAAPS